ncbi:PIG-L family deacetylase [Herbidospora sp. NBRC 101105]|uniref:PIG-L deacetylase family protein n=1 Tax=Herbidospora sp. NBRC 101105 TaxID=3032195 RepID=UPI0024A491B0|nr:PIG-L family deacetylase [Herbidospora sp. NBRC 101105]GLX95527.1 PIG-L domain-containing protein [Herbidospora sp. NBRC 101105]
MTINWSDQRALILAPHPDDEVIGCGGLISRIAEAGGQVHVMYLTIGENVSHASPGFSTRAENLHEIDQVAAHLRITSWHVALPGIRQLTLDHVPRRTLTAVIEDATPISLTTLKPTLIAFPHPTSYNQDHQAVAEAAVTALRPSDRRKRPHPAIVLAFEEAADQWRLTSTPPPAFYVELETRHLNAKLEAMDLYASQRRDHPHTRSDETLRSLAVLRGMQCGVTAAEAFECVQLMA